MIVQTLLYLLLAFTLALSRDPCASRQLNGRYYAPDVPLPEDSVPCVIFANGAATSCGEGIVAASLDDSGAYDGVFIAEKTLDGINLMVGGVVRDTFDQLDGVLHWHDDDLLVVTNRSACITMTCTRPTNGEWPEAVCSTVPAPAPRCATPTYYENGRGVVFMAPAPATDDGMVVCWAHGPCGGVDGAGEMTLWPDMLMVAGTRTSGQLAAYDPLADLLVTVVLDEDGRRHLAAHSGEGVALESTVVDGGFGEGAVQLMVVPDDEDCIGSDDPKCTQGRHLVFILRSDGVILRYGLALGTEGVWVFDPAPRFATAPALPSPIVAAPLVTSTSIYVLGAPKGAQEAAWAGAMDFKDMIREVMACKPCTELGYTHYKGFCKPTMPNYYCGDGIVPVPCPSDRPLAPLGSISEDACVGCAAGTYADVSAGACRPCPRGKYCLGGGAATPCPPEAPVSPAGAVSAAECRACQAGYHPTNAAVCVLCPYGHYCPDGVTATACPAATPMSALGSTGPAACTPCPAESHFDPAHGCVTARGRMVSDPVEDANSLYHVTTVGEIVGYVAIAVVGVSMLLGVTWLVNPDRFAFLTGKSITEMHAVPNAPLPRPIDTTHNLRHRHHAGGYVLASDTVSAEVPRGPPQEERDA